MIRDICMRWICLYNATFKYHDRKSLQTDFFWVTHCALLLYKIHKRDHQDLWVGCGPKFITEVIYQRDCIDLWGSIFAVIVPPWQSRGTSMRQWVEWRTKNQCVHKERVSLRKPTNLLLYWYRVNTGTHIIPLQASSFKIVMINDLDLLIISYT